MLVKNCYSWIICCCIIGRCWLSLYKCWEKWRWPIF